MNKPEVTKCLMCGTECIVEGEMTLHFKPVRETEIQRLKEQVELLRGALQKISTTFCGCWDECDCGSRKINELAKEALKEFAK